MKERTEGELDARKRRRLEREDAEDERAERVERAAEGRVQAMLHWMKKWDGVAAQSASDYRLMAPAPIPLGATSPVLFALSPTLPSSFPLSASHAAHAGATTNPTYIGRQCSRLGCMKAFLPAEGVEQIAAQVSNSIQRRVARGDLQRSHHLRPVTEDEIWIWICQRLQFSLEKRKTLRDQFNSVRFPACLWSLRRASILARRTASRLGGCHTIDSPRSKVTSTLIWKASLIF